jgi:hypothetical protein
MSSIWNAVSKYLPFGGRVSLVHLEAAEADDQRLIGKDLAGACRAGSSCRVSLTLQATNTTSIRIRQVGLGRTTVDKRVYGLTEQVAELAG